MKKKSRLLKVIPARLDQKKLKPDQALKLLKEGNLRFSTQRNTTPQLQNPYELESLNHSHLAPFGIVLTCSDSHIPVENLFDVELGSLFVYRVTGHAVSDLLLAGIEHALSYYDISVIVVLGHSDCQAVETSFQHSKRKLKQVLTPGQHKLIATILESDPHPTHFEELLWSNIRSNGAKLRQNSKIISTLIKKGKLKVVGAAFQPSSGTVQFATPRIKPIKRKAA